MNALDIDQLISEDPQLHLDGRGGRTSWALQPDVLRFIAQRVEPGWRTLETGIGVSTVVFASAGARHTAIAHHREEVEAVAEYCRSRGLDTEGLTLINDRSENALPRLVDEGALDCVLIDGRHAFPTPFIDWYYTVIRVRVGGLIIVDDLVLKTGRILCEFMEADHRFDRVVSFRNTVAFSLLEGDIEIGEFINQPWMCDEQ